MKIPIYLILWILIFFFSCKNTRPSLQTTTGHSSTTGNIALYYELVHEAELALIRDKYAIAIDYYLAASEECTLFIKDLENALLLSIEAKNYTTALIFADKLFQKGVPKT